MSSTCGSSSSSGDGRQRHAEYVLAGIGSCAQTHRAGRWISSTLKIVPCPATSCVKPQLSREASVTFLQCLHHACKLELTLFAEAVWNQHRMMSYEPGWPLASK